MGHKFQALTPETLAGNRTLTAAEVAEYSVFAFDPGGSARDLSLPAASSANKGEVLFIANTADAAEIITIDDGDGGDIATPTQNETAICISDGSNWHGLVGASS